MNSCAFWCASHTPDGWRWRRYCVQSLSLSQSQQDDRETHRNTLSVSRQTRWGLKETFTRTCGPCWKSFSERLTPRTLYGSAFSNEEHMDFLGGLASTPVTNCFQWSMNMLMFVGVVKIRLQGKTSFGLSIMLLQRPMDGWTGMNCLSFPTLSAIRWERKRTSKWWVVSVFLSALFMYLFMYLFLYLCIYLLKSMISG